MSGRNLLETSSFLAMENILGRRAMVRVVPLVVLFLLAVSFISDRHLVALEGLTTVLIRDVPHVKQVPDFCGEACVEMWPRSRKVSIDHDHVFDQSELDPLLGRGCNTKELAGL